MTAQRNQIITCLGQGAFVAALLCLAFETVAREPQANSTGPNYSTRELLGLLTNGPAVYQVLREPRPAPANAPQTENTPRYSTNLAFDYFLPNTLNHLVWTNFLAQTNGRTMALWSVREHPAGWPSKPPLLLWNTNCLAWGMKGLTAISQCWSDEGAPGQAPVTALTRRHGYLRGHSMGPDGFTPGRNGKKIWFATTDNKVVEVKVADTVIRIGGGRDYTIVLFDRDLPPGIEPLRVVAQTNLVVHYPYRMGIPRPVFQPEQLGNISAGVPGFSFNSFKGGDSGSPDLLPMPGELVFFGGRSTSGPSADMQADIDALCRRHKLNPANYQLQWLDLSRFPAF